MRLIGNKTYFLLATMVFGGIGIHATHENIPGMRWHTSHAKMGCAERWMPGFGGQDKSYPPCFRIRI